MSLLEREGYLIEDIMTGKFYSQPSSRFSATNPKVFKRERDAKARRTVVTSYAAQYEGMPQGPFRILRCKIIFEVEQAL